MNTPPNVPPGPPPDSSVAAQPSLAATDPMYWSIRRELWENRSLTIAPLAVTAFVLFVLLITAFGLPRKMRTLPTLDPAKQHALVANHFSMAPGPIMITTILVGIFFSLDALHGERRDRSILFWKSLPVSDLTTVLSKVIIPLVVLPLIAFAIVVCVRLIMGLETGVVLIFHGMSPATTWAHVPMFQNWLVLLYGLVVLALWLSPLYGWLS